MGNYQKAIEDADQALQIDPNLAKAYLNRSAAHLGLGEYQKAIEDADQALQINPNLARAYFNWGLAHYQLGEDQEAIADLQKAAQLFLDQGEQANYERTRTLIQKLQ
ncbi:MAG: hypothetical protein BRC54_11510 [Cyanobacteria bacterium SW_7_48_12]|nr:MAG: hypothetical protein BRC54_11510 [Cyanobacteria bacterium SW_7_48_12]